LPAADLRDSDHSGTQSEVGVGDVIERGGPALQVVGAGGEAVGEFLAVAGVALIGEVDGKVGVVGEDEGLPDGGGAVVRIGRATGNDGGDIFPGEAAPKLARAGGAIGREWLKHTLCPCWRTFECWCWRSLRGCGFQPT
jgi:hypothetical protein